MLQHRADQPLTNTLVLVRLSQMVQYQLPYIVALLGITSLPGIAKCILNLFIIATTKLSFFSTQS